MKGNIFASYLAGKVRKILNGFGIDMLLLSEIEDLRRKSLFSVSKQDLLFITECGFMFPDGWLVSFVPMSRSQTRQDIFALGAVGLKTEGYFVEFGATDGLSLSNTWLLETTFGWSGILSEPAHSWHSALRSNRSCIIDNRCVWRDSGEKLLFSEASRPEYSTLDGFENNDHHGGRRIHSSKYIVETVSLMDLLEEHGAPSHIDFLSIDTEGSEFEILRNFDFGRYSFGAISVEHNFSENREMLFNLLVKNGYRRVYENASGHDDWYIPMTVPNYDAK